jgi:hypothetical protein
VFTVHAIVSFRTNKFGGADIGNSVQFVSNVGTGFRLKAGVKRQQLRWSSCFLASLKQHVPLAEVTSLRCDGALNWTVRVREFHVPECCRLLYLCLELIGTAKCEAIMT